MAGPLEAEVLADNGAGDGAIELVDEARHDAGIWMNPWGGGPISRSRASVCVCAWVRVWGVVAA